jgi:hypothetical protein
MMTRGRAFCLPTMMMALTTHALPSPSPQSCVFVIITMVQDHYEDNHGDEK